MEQIMKSLVFLTLCLQLSSAGTHKLQYFYTAVKGINFPEFTTVGQVDGEQIDYYDSNIRKAIPKTEWIKKNDAVDPDYWNRNTQIYQGSQESFKAGVQILMERFNQTKGVHTVQQMYGCELDDDKPIQLYNQYSYDGEDFLSLDVDTVTWTAPVPQAVPTKQKWETAGQAQYWKDALKTVCIEWLKKYVGYGKDTLERKVSPKLDLFQSDSSSPVVCHATGFFPRAVMISWKKNGEDVYEDVELRETLPNQDGTFQKRSILTVSPEELNSDKYTCVVQHGGLNEELVLKVSDRRVLSGGVPVGIIIGVLAAVLVLIAAVVGGVIWKKKSDKRDFKPVPGNANAPSDTSSDTS